MPAARQPSCAPAGLRHLRYCAGTACSATASWPALMYSPPLAWQASSRREAACSCSSARARWYSGLAVSEPYREVSALYCGGRHKCVLSVFVFVSCLRGGQGQQSGRSAL